MAIFTILNFAKTFFFTLRYYPIAVANLHYLRMLHALKSDKTDNKTDNSALRHYFSYSNVLFAIYAFIFALILARGYPILILETFGEIRGSLKTYHITNFRNRKSMLTQ